MRAARLRVRFSFLHSRGFVLRADEVTLDADPALPPDAVIQEARRHLRNPPTVRETRIEILRPAA